jgi:uncharacterized protein (DUF934 family)
MRKIIKDGVVAEDSWRGRLLDLESFNEAAASGDAPAPDLGVQLEPDQPPSELSGDLNAIPLIAINFPVFTDGRGFSYARELRERGYEGEIRAVGHFIRDQLGYLARCGFNAFDFAENTNLESALAGLGEFHDQYQADVLQPEPLFRRR